jgi:hypothetical protein
MGFDEGRHMNIFDAISTSNDLVTGHIASNVFSVLPEDGPSVVIIDRHGHRYTSEPDALLTRGVTEEAIHDLCSRIDDGYEPIITKSGDTTLVGTHLTTDRCNYGYVLVLLKDYCPVTAMSNITLFETILGQMNLVARLTERIVDKLDQTRTSPAWATCLN